MNFQIRDCLVVNSQFGKQNSLYIFKLSWMYFLLLLSVLSVLGINFVVVFSYGIPIR